MLLSNGTKGAMRVAKQDIIKKVPIHPLRMVVGIISAVKRKISVEFQT